MDETSIHQIVNTFKNLSDDDREIIGDAAERYMDEVCSGVPVAGSLPSMLPFLLGWVAVLDRQVNGSIIARADRLAN